MTTIKVDPSILQSNGQNIQSEGQSISSAGSKVLGAASGAPSYEGQFGPRVYAIGQDAYSKLGSSANQLNDIGSRVYVKGVEFQVVDNESLTGFGFPGGGTILNFSDPGQDSKSILDILHLGNLIDSKTAVTDPGNSLGFDNAFGHFFFSTGEHDVTTVDGEGPLAGWGSVTNDISAAKAERDVNNVIFGIPVSEKDEIDVDQVEWGLQGNPSKGLLAGNAGFTDFSVQRDRVIGDKNLGLTQEDTFKVGDVGISDGYHDGEFGFDAHADLASAQGSYGINIAGFNINVSGSVGLGYGIDGLKVGHIPLVGDALEVVGIPLHADLGFNIAPAIGN